MHNIIEKNACNKDFTGFKHILAIGQTCYKLV